MKKVLIAFTSIMVLALSGCGGASGVQEGSSNQDSSSLGSDKSAQTQDTQQKVSNSNQKSLIEDSMGAQVPSLPKQ